MSTWFRKELFNNRVVKKTSDEIFSDNMIEKEVDKIF